MKITRPDLPAVASIIGIVATVVALGWWSIVGWMTPAQHEEDITHIEDHAQKTERAILEFQDRWQCDEWTEELDDLLALTDQTPLDGERIRRLRARADNKECERFDD